jgi:hypothetical protein
MHCFPDLVKNSIIWTTNSAHMTELFKIASICGIIFYDYGKLKMC